MAPSGDKAQLKPLYHELMQTLQQFKQSGVDKARLEQINGMAEANAVFALESVQGKVTQLASNQTFYGQPDRIETQLAELRAVSPQSVSQVFNQYLDGQHKVTLSVVPKVKRNWRFKRITLHRQSGLYLSITKLATVTFIIAQ